MESNPNQNNRTREIVSALAVLLVIVAIVSTAAATNTKPKTLVQTATKSTKVATNAKYKDGQYSATGSYTSPGGRESIKVTVTLASNVVTDTMAVSGANDPLAGVYQGQFIGGFKAKVVGQNINTLKLSRVSGSSLTSQGFNDAIAQIKQQAQG